MRWKESVGKAAEFLVCYEFASLGYNVSHCPFELGAYDVLVDHASQFLRVQVKGTLGPSEYGGGPNAPERYAFSVRRTSAHRLQDADLYALVALDIGAVYYVHRAEMEKRGSKMWVPRSKFGAAGTTVDDVAAAFLNKKT